MSSALLQGTDKIFFLGEKGMAKFLQLMSGQH